MKNELLARLSALENVKPIRITRGMLNGGMQERLNRSRKINFNRRIKEEKNNVRNQLDIILEKEKLFDKNKIEDLLL